MDISDVLLVIRDVLREHGWTQDTIRGPDNKVCVLGAMGSASHTVCSRGQARAAYAHLSRFCEYEFGLPVALVNDTLLTSEDEACDLLEAAAKWDGPA